MSGHSIIAVTSIPEKRSTAIQIQYIIHVTDLKKSELMNMLLMIGKPCR